MANEKTNKNGQEKIWDYFQTEMSESFKGALPRLTFLCKKLKKGQKVLNIGVGDGAFEKLSSASGMEVYCLDPSEKAIKNIKNELKLGDKAKVGYSQSIPFNSGFFDVVVMTEVLEHLPDDTLQQTLIEVNRVLKNDGNFLITVPFDEVLSTNQAICPQCELVFHRWGHEQTFTKERLRALLEEKSFLIKSINIRAFPDWSRRDFGGLIKSIFRYILGRFGVGISQPNIFLIAIKKEKL